MATRLAAWNGEYETENIMALARKRKRQKVGDFILSMGRGIAPALQEYLSDKSDTPSSPNETFSFSEERPPEIAGLLDCVASGGTWNPETETCVMPTSRTTPQKLGDFITSTTQEYARRV